MLKISSDKYYGNPTYIHTIYKRHHFSKQVYLGHDFDMATGSVSQLTQEYCWSQSNGKLLRHENIQNVTQNISIYGIHGMVYTWYKRFVGGIECLSLQK